MKKAAFFLVIFLHTLTARPQLRSGGGEDNPDLKTNEASLENWRKLRFGMFIHWGPVSQKGTEIGWSRGKEVIFGEYDSLYLTFNPVHFNAEEWVDLMKRSGMKYLVFVTRHHDGFVMWDSETTGYDIMSTPYKRDLLKELSEACNRHGILFGTYYSILDWKHPDYPVEHNHPQKRTGADMDRFVVYIKSQLKELVEKYHTKIVWFDGEWEDPWTHQMGMDLYRYVRELDPEILINNRVDKGREGMEGTTRSDKFAGDFSTPEQRVGRFDTLSAWESCITLGTQWSWKPDDIVKSKEECIHTLVKTAGGDGNLLLNIGPMPDGRIDPGQADRLMDIGKWLSAYGESIYETRGGPLPPQEWGVTTRMGNKIFLHVLKPRKNLKVTGLPYQVTSARSLNLNERIFFRYSENELLITLPQSPDTPVMDHIIELTITE